VVLCDEFVSMIEKFFGWCQRLTLALDVIRHVGLGEVFVTNGHTLGGLRKEYRYRLDELMTINWKRILLGAIESRHRCSVWSVPRLSESRT